MSKRRNICLSVNNSTLQTTLSHETGIFSWQAVLAVVLNLKNRLPEPWQDVIPIENVADLKMVIKLFTILLGVFLMGGIYDMFLLQEGGAL